MKTLTEQILELKTVEEINQVIAAIRTRQAELQSRAAMAFMVGQKVNFKGKFGGTVQGVVTKLNRKTIEVKAETGTTWKVSPSLLKTVA